MTKNTCINIIMLGTLLQTPESCKDEDALSQLDIIISATCLWYLHIKDYWTWIYLPFWSLVICYKQQHNRQQFRFMAQNVNIIEPCTEHA